MTDSNLSGRLTADGHELLQRVYFEDTDFSGRVYHARYLQFLERGRTDFLRLRGVHHHELADEGLAFAVTRMELDFRAAASIDDVLAVSSRLRKAGGARIVLEQAIHRGDRLIVSAQVTAALLDAAGRPVRMPPTVRAALT